MEPRERVISVIRHCQPDRIPVYGWVSANLTPQITAVYGSVALFEDHYEFDYAHLFGGPATYTPASLETAAQANGGVLDPAAVLDIPTTDPNAEESYGDLREQIRHHKQERNRFVYVQTPGIFEALNGVFGIENHLLFLLLYPEVLRDVYQRQARWNRQFALNCLDLGVDMIHVSDDWGSQHGLLFSKETWRDLIYPAHKITADAVKRHNGFLSIHSDGNIKSLVEGIMELGYEVVHPWQESAGMSLDEYHAKYRGLFSVMGGLDVQTTLGFGNYELLETSIRRVVRLFQEGGLLFCTSHFVQDHCSIEELGFAFDLIYRLVREKD